MTRNLCRPGGLLFQLFICLYGLCTQLATAQTFDFASSLVEISVASGFNHAPVRIPITTTPSGGSLAGMTASSDAGWVTPSVDVAGSRLVLNFTTAGLVNATSTANITVSLSGQNKTLVVKAYASTLVINRIKDDPFRSRTYGIQQNALGLGSVVVIDPIGTNFIANVTVGKKPTDMAVTADGQELLVINCVDKTISVIDLTSLAVKETLTLAQFSNSNINELSANIAVGPGDIIYYSDGAWAPLLRVLKRSTMQVLQSTGIDSNGIGDFALNSDKTFLFAWAQYGWTAGWAGSYIAKFSVAEDGLLNWVESTPSVYPTVLARDPQDSPVFLSDDDTTVFIKQLAVSADSVTVTKHGFSGVVYSISPGGQVVATSTAIYDTDTGVKLADLPVSAPVQAITSDYSRLVYYDAAAHAVKVLNLFSLIGPEHFNLVNLPADGSITLAPARLQWTPVAGANSYRVYLGTSQSAVATAGTGSGEYLGATGLNYFDLSYAFAPGATYYWRIDSVSTLGVDTGSVYSFTVSQISSSTNLIVASTVTGHANQTASFQLDSATAGAAWRVSANQSWVQFAQTTGTTPATVQLRLDASQLAAGQHQATITVSDGSNTPLFTVPLKFKVAPLYLTLLKSDPQSVFAYGISEDTGATPRQAYLLEINMLTEAIERVVPVGSSVTDLAVHDDDNRLYVPNWLTGSLLALDKNTLENVHTYAFAPFGGVGYSQGDIYRVSAGGPGRLIWEAEDQWVDLSIFDTVNSVNLGKAFVREGGGGTGANKRYYYHGDSNISNAELHKFDMNGDVFSELAHIRVAYVNYYGSREVVVSDDGQRIYWNGGVFDENLNLLWNTGESIHATSPDGRYAFGQTKVYDVENHLVLTNSTPASAVKAFNALTDKLVYKNGTGLGFMRLNHVVSLSPANGAVIATAGMLQWEGLSQATGYRVYLAQSAQDLLGADTGSPAYQGEVTGTSFTLPSDLAGGTYYWRIDAITAFGVIKGDVRYFVLSPVVPGLSVIAASTFPNRPVTVDVALDSVLSGQQWAAAADAGWIQLAETSGVTPATLHVTLDASVAAPAFREGTITVRNSAGVLFTIPVSETVEKLNLTRLVSDPLSAKVYGISEDPASNPARAFLLEIDTATEKIERVVPVGSSVTDLALHNADNRLYVPNWSIGHLLAVGKDSFQLERTYTFAPFGGVGYSQGDIYRVTSGGAGRLVWEEADQWIKVRVFDTAAGSNLAELPARQGGGASTGGGRYYYHGDDNSSGAELHKFDLQGDQFSELAHIRVESASYFGSRTVVASEDGTRVFWNGSMFDANLAEQWTMGNEVFATSADGRYAFTRSLVYDTVNRQAVYGMPADTAVSAFNSSSGKLVVQMGGQLGFYALGAAAVLPAPVISVGSIDSTAVELLWTESTLETQFTLQGRLVGAPSWTDLATPSRNAARYVVTGLVDSSTYEFRIRADAAGVSSPWSNLLNVTTAALPPVTPQFTNSVATTNSVTLEWTNPINETAFVLERRIGSGGTWSVLANLGANVTIYKDTFVQSLVTYEYRVKALKNLLASGYSDVRSVTVPAPPVPAAPGGFAAEPLPGVKVILTWEDLPNETGYRIQRRNSTSGTWTTVATPVANSVSQIDANVILGTQYYYRIQAFNAQGDSEFSQEDEVTVMSYVTVASDDFDPGIEPALWQSITGGVSTNGGPSFGTTKVLYFSGTTPRVATTMPQTVLLGGTIEFKFRAGNEASDGSFNWNNSEAGESVVLEYSKDGGQQWTLIRTLATVYPANSVWTSYFVTMPADALGYATQFRWRQLAHSGLRQDVWALEDVVFWKVPLAAPSTVPFIISSPSSSTSVAIFWATASRAEYYQLQRRLTSVTWTNLAVITGAENFYTDTGLSPGTAYTYRVQAVNSSGFSPFSPLTTSLTLSRMEEWYRQEFGGSASVSVQSLVTPAQDGSLPLLRYAFNLNSSEAEREMAPGGNSGYPSIQLDRQRQVLYAEFIRLKAALNPGITYQVEFSNDLVTWTPAGHVISVTPIDSKWERVVFEDDLNGGQGGRRYSRVSVRLE